MLLLAGVTLNSFLSSIIMFVQYLADFAQVYRAARWIMGDLDIGGYDTLVASLPLVIVAFALFALLLVPQSAQRRRMLPHAASMFALNDWPSSVPR